MKLSPIAAAISNCEAVDAAIGDHAFVNAVMVDHHVVAVRHVSLIYITNSLLLPHFVYIYVSY